MIHGYLFSLEHKTPHSYVASSQRHLYYTVMPMDNGMKILVT